MFKVYHEHPNFEEYVAFDLSLGKMMTINKQQFDQFENQSLKFSNTICSSYHTQFPRRIYFQITRNCQLSCDYCYVKAGPKQPHLEKSVIFNLVNYMGKNGLMEVRLTGGEATTHPNFVEICDQFLKNNIYISVGTNGLWSNQVREYLSEQPYFCLAVTIDGTEVTHANYREGSHKALINNLVALRKNNPYIRIRINMVVTKSNQFQYRDLIQFAHDINAESLTFLPLRPRLSNPELLHEVISADEFRELAFNITRHINSNDNNNDNLSRNDYDPFAFFKDRKVCPAGRERLNLSFDAYERKISTFACSFSPAMENNINHKIREHFIAGEFSYDEIDRLKNIWQDNNKWDIFRDHQLKAAACTSCSSFGKSCGGTGFCHIQNHKYLQLKPNEDLRQQLRTQMTKLPIWCAHVKS